MANIHLKEAARNIRRALDDIDLKVKQIKAETDDKIRADEEKIREIQQQQAQLGGLMTQAENDGERTSRSNQIRDLEQEINDIRQSHIRLRQEQERQERDLNNFKVELSQTASHLEMSA